MAKQATSVNNDAREMKFGLFDSGDDSYEVEMVLRRCSAYNCNSGCVLSWTGIIWSNILNLNFHFNLNLFMNDYMTSKLHRQPRRVIASNKIGARACACCVCVRVFICIYDIIQHWARDWPNGATAGRRRSSTGLLSYVIWDMLCVRGNNPPINPSFVAAWLTQSGKPMP